MSQKFPNEHRRFIHIPKTAGGYLGDTLGIDSLGHKHFSQRARDLVEFVGTSAGAITYRKPTNCFAVIRNPFSWLVSYYLHDSGGSGWGDVNNIHGFNSFQEFIQAYCDNEFAWHVAMLKDFAWAQLYTDTGLCVPRFLLYFEALADGLMETLGIDATQKEPTIDYRTFYTDKMITILNEKCWWELNWFGYDFDGKTSGETFMIPDPNHSYIPTEKLHIIMTEET